jgi:hypothetical protein
VAVRITAYYALASATGIVLVWALTWADAIPAQFAPRQLDTTHVVAELGMALVLLLGAAKTLRDRRPHWSLAAGLGALVYASVNVMGDFAEEPAMLAMLVSTVALAIAALVVAFRRTGRSQEDGLREDGGAL